MEDRDPPSAIGGRPADVPRLSSAWDHFYAHCSAIISQTPGVRRLPQVDREDCIQEVMLELVRKFGEGESAPTEAHLTGWIRLTSRNKAVDIVRRRYRHPEVGFDDGSGERLIDPGGASEGLDAARAEEVSLIWEALLKLDHKVPVTSYLIFYLHAIEGWKVPELAELFGISAEQVRFRCHRVKKKFEAILESGERDRDAGGRPRADRAPTDRDG